MIKIFCVFLFAVAGLFAQCANTQPMIYDSTSAYACDTTIPQWHKYIMTAIANGVSGCANANGCWQVNSGTPVNKTAGLTQDVVLFQLPASGYITNARIKSATACTGTTTLTTTLGTATANTFFVSSLV